VDKGHSLAPHVFPAACLALYPRPIAFLPFPVSNQPLYALKERGLFIGFVGRFSRLRLSWRVPPRRRLLA
jgi:hypothetical protein